MPRGTVARLNEDAEPAIAAALGRILAADPPPPGAGRPFVVVVELAALFWTTNRFVQFLGCRGEPLAIELVAEEGSEALERARAFFETDGERIACSRLYSVTSNVPAHHADAPGLAAYVACAALRDVHRVRSDARVLVQTHIPPPGPPARRRRALRATLADLFHPSPVLEAL